MTTPYRFRCPRSRCSVDIREEMSPMVDGTAKVEVVFNPNRSIPVPSSEEKHYHKQHSKANYTSNRSPGYRRSARPKAEVRMWALAIMNDACREEEEFFKLKSG